MSQTGTSELRVQQQQRRKSTGRLHAGKERHPLTVPSARRVCMVAHAPLFLRAGRRASTRALLIDKADVPAELTRWRSADGDTHMS